jgi:hypothetical protein
MGATATELALQHARHAIELSVGRSRAKAGLFEELHACSTFHELHRFLLRRRAQISELCLLQLQLRLLPLCGYQAWMSSSAPPPGSTEMTALERLRLRLKAVAAVTAAAAAANRGGNGGGRTDDEEGQREQRWGRQRGSSSLLSSPCAVCGAAPMTCLCERWDVEGAGGGPRPTPPLGRRPSPRSRFRAAVSATQLAGATRVGGRAALGGTHHVAGKGARVGPAARVFGLGVAAAAAQADYEAQVAAAAQADKELAEGGEGGTKSAGAAGQEEAPPTPEPSRPRHRQRHAKSTNTISGTEGYG